MVCTFLLPAAARARAMTTPEASPFATGAAAAMEMAEERRRMILKCIREKCVWLCKWKLMVDECYWEINEKLRHFPLAVKELESSRENESS